MSVPIVTELDCTFLVVQYCAHLQEQVAFVVVYQDDTDLPIGTWIELGDVITDARLYSDVITYLNRETA